LRSQLEYRSVKRIDPLIRALEVSRPPTSGSLETIYRPGVGSSWLVSASSTFTTGRCSFGSKSNLRFRRVIFKV